METRFWSASRSTVLSSLVLVAGVSVGCDSGTGAQASRGTELPAVVDNVDLERYRGLWYEIARYPNRFEDPSRYRCVGVTAEYGIRDDGRVSVTNTCRKDQLDGETTVSKGVARSVIESNAKLEVTFAPEWIPGAWGAYWIFDLTDDYSAALVGHPNGRYLWVLSRTPQLDDAVWTRMLQSAEARGFDTDRLQRVPQPSFDDGDGEQAKLRSSEAAGPDAQRAG